MINRVLKLFRTKRREKSVKNLLISLLGANISIFIICFVIILVANWILVLRVNQIVDFQVSASRVIVQTIRNINEATYTAYASMESSRYETAKIIINNKITKSIEFIDNYLNENKYLSAKDLINLNKDFLELKMYLYSYRSIFTSYIMKRQALNIRENTINNLIATLNEELAVFKSELSKKVVELGINGNLKPYYQQALTDTIMLTYDVSKYRLDLFNHIGYLVNGVNDHFDIRHHIAKLNFKINSIFLNVGTLSSSKENIKNLMNYLDEASLKSEELAKEVNREYNDSHFYYSVIAGMEYEFNTEITNRVNDIQYRLVHLRRNVLIMVLGVIGLGIVFFLISIFMIKYRIFYPFSVFLNAIQSASKGKRDIEVKLETNDEFGVLAEHFNRMSKSIIERESELIHEKELVEEKSNELESLKRYIEDIIHASPNAILTVDRDLKVLFINKKAERLANGKELVGNRLSDTKCILNKYCDDIKEVLNTGREKVLYKEEVFFPDSTKLIVDLYIYPLHTINGIGAVVEIEDVTEEVFMEEKMLESQKMETVGLLAGGFAHDFNNLLTGLMGYVELAMMNRDQNKIYEYLKRVKDISLHASKLVQQILLFSRTGPEKKELVDIGVVIEGALNMIKSPIKMDVNLIKEIEKNLNIYADASQLTQAILNLVINAFEAVSKKKDGYVKIKAERLKKVEEEKLNLNREKEYVKITVEDNGFGMSDEIKSKIFEPFFTTKMRGNIKGTGLGLSIVYRVIKNHDGEIRVTSEVGTGTRFDIYLPIQREEKDIKKRTSVKKEISGSGRILLVDDENMVRDVGKEILENLGYEVVAVKSGRECIDFMRKSEKDIDLIIMDLIMPEMDGPETLKELSKMGVKIPVLIASGYITLDMSYLRDYDYIKGMIKKPYSIEDISAKLARILNKK